MRPARRLLGLLLLTLSAAPAALTIAGGCGTETPPPDASALRAAFPEQEAAVLGHGDGFTATGQGFTAASRQDFGGARGIAAELPRTGSGVIRLSLSDGFEVRVRELSAEGEGVMVDNAIAYRRAGGTAYWTAAPDKVEEWLHITARRGEVAAAWEVEGATLEQRGEVVALIDREGAARMWVSAPSAFAAGGRPIGTVLRAANGRIELEVKDADGEVLVDPAWTKLPPMSAPRVWHAAVPINKGRVLIAGGSSGMGFPTTTEAFDSAGMGSWKPLPPLSKGRERLTLTVLDNGNVLALGGFSGNFENVAEIFNIDTDMWMTIPPMDMPRSRHTATLLASGRVLVVGGENASKAIPSSQLFDPYNGYWPSPSFPSTARFGHTATLLGDGTVLVAGGIGVGGATLKSAQIYRPDMGEFEDTTELSEPRVGHTATLLFDGRVLVTGGNNTQALKSGEIFEPGTKKWSPIPDMSEQRANHAAVALSSGKVLVTGGSLGPSVSKSTDMYDPNKGEWVTAGMLGTAREGHTMTRLADGRVVIAGGQQGMVVLASAEMFHALPLGSHCDAGEECLSGFCADEACCDSACDADDDDDCSAEGDLPAGFCEVTNGTTCDANNPCPPVDCKKPVCVSGLCKYTNSPDGSICKDSKKCTVGDKCSNGTCAGTERECFGFDQCQVNGLTCDETTGQCPDVSKEVCTITGERPEENPTVPNGVTLCNENNPCADGRVCADGVCCNEACDSTCYSCIVPGKEGKCEPVPAGFPDLNSDCGQLNACSTTCSGEGTCVEASAGSVCSPQECFHDGIHGAIAATCSGPGDDCSSAERIPFNCSPYRCVSAFGACSTSCKSLRDCAEPYVCSPEGQCVSAPAVSSGYASTCSLAPAPASPRYAWLAALFAASLVARRRQRHC